MSVVEEFLKFKEMWRNLFKVEHSLQCSAGETNFHKMNENARDFLLQRQKCQNGLLDISFFFFFFIEFYRFGIPYVLSLKLSNDVFLFTYTRQLFLFFLFFFFFCFSCSWQCRKDQSGYSRSASARVITHAWCVLVDRCYYSSTIFNPVTIMHTVTSRHRLK